MHLVIALYNTNETKGKTRTTVTSFFAVKHQSSSVTTKTEVPLTQFVPEYNLSVSVAKHILKSRSHIQNERKRPIYMTAKVRKIINNTQKQEIRQNGSVVKHKRSSKRN